MSWTPERHFALRTFVKERRRDTQEEDLTQEEKIIRWLSREAADALDEIEELRSWKNVSSRNGR